MTKVSHQRFSCSEELRELDEKIIALTGKPEFLGEQSLGNGSYRYVFANAEPMIGQAEPVVYMQGRLRAAEEAALEQG